ncbi:MAG: FUSC family protein [Gluconacetobacter diazotrophicus]|nr:FUSC family protein [Gluconacetobacter diazotrophicus]
MTFNITAQSWTFGFRNWVAMVLALLAAFWLQLDSPSSAAVCVGILALPTRGQALQKGIYRVAGTVLGVVASVVIAGLFAQTRDLFIVAVAAWLALCVFAAGLLEGNRAYGAVLSGYTVAIVAVGQVDTPQSVFLSGVARGAAEVLGIVTLAVVNDVLFAPDLFPGLMRRLETAHGRVHDFVLRTLRSGHADPNEVASLLTAITALRPDITALPGEAISGRARAAAARVAAMALVRQVMAARIVTDTLLDLGAAGEGPRSDIMAAMADPSGDGARALRDKIDDMSLHNVAPTRLIARAAALVLLDQGCRATEALAAMRSGRWLQQVPDLPVFRSRRAARRDAVRAFLATVVAGFFFVVTGWPAASLALTQLAALVGISATNPDPRSFAKGAVAAMPLAALAGGVTQFLVLDGVDAFPLLAIAMAPPIFLASLMLTSGNTRLFGAGFLLLVFFPVFLSPANPQGYNPLTFLETALLANVAVVGFFLCLTIILPTSDSMRRRWFEQAGDDGLAAAMAGTVRTAPPVEAFRDADRIAQLARLTYDSDERRDEVLREALRVADLSGALRRLRFALDDPALPSPQAEQARAAFSSLEPADLGAAASALTRVDDQDEDTRLAARQAGAALAFAASLLDQNRGGSDLALDRPVAA